jgi:hypothetical protein
MTDKPIPPLYKYLDVNGAYLTLTNKNFRHAKPSEFEDKEDMKILRVFPEEELDSLNLQKNNFTDVILRNLNRPPTCYNLLMRMQIALLQQVYRNDPDAAELVKQTVQNDRVEDIYDVDRLRGVSEDTMREVNEHLQGYRVLCLTKNNNSEKMWEQYAESHQGIVLKVVPNHAKDSKFSLLKEVRYVDERPPLFPSSLAFIEDSLFGNQDQNNKRYIDTVIYTKTKEYDYECEYRLAIPHFPHENWNTLPYHGEEIAELYLGVNTSEMNKEKFTGLVRTINPAAKLFQTIRNTAEELEFIELT